MKAFKLSIVLLIVIITGSLYFIRVINTTMETMLSKIESLEHAVKTADWQSAETQMNEIQETWGKNEQWMTTLVNHGEIDEIKMRFAKLSQYIRFKEAPLFMAEVTAVKLLIQNIAATEKVNLSNFL
ncbi:MAG: DUF4363 family protein [Firmicutes bacterium]|nr:DUF4363 family protein [Bacillota bacterium]